MKSGSQRRSDGPPGASGTETSPGAQGRGRGRGRRIFVGDVQGCAAELEDLLERVAFDPELDELHPVGDFVNRGPDSLGVLRRLSALGAGGVLGNHDVHLLRVAAGTRKLGRRDTLDEVLAAPDRDELLGWLAARPFVRAWDDLVCVHAGLAPTWDDPVATLTGIDPIERDERSDFATRVRYCDAEGRRPASDWPEPDAASAFVPWTAHFPRRDDEALGTEARRIVFGHWARRGLFVSPGLRGLDTGCVWGGRLTAWIAEEDRLVQVDARETYRDPG